MKLFILFYFLFSTNQLYAAADLSDAQRAERTESIRHGIVKSSFALALNLIEARQQNLHCNLDASQEKISSIVYQVSSMATAEEMLLFTRDFDKDADIWKNLSFKLSVANKRAAPSLDDLKKYLVGSMFWGPSRGAYGPMATVEFLDSNKIRLGSLELVQSTPDFRWIYSEADWELNALPEGEFHLRIGTKNYLYKEESNEIRFVPTKSSDDSWNETLMDSPMECDA